MPFELVPFAALERKVDSTATQWTAMILDLCTVIGRVPLRGDGSAGLLLNIFRQLRHGHREFFDG
jgi:hypothetical protein